MTTYTWQGFATYYSNTTETEIAATFTGITLEIIVPQSTTTMQYTVLPLGPGGTAPEDLYIDTAIDSYNIRLNGKDVAFAESLFSLDWSGANTSILYVAELYDVSVGGLGLVDAIHHFEFGGTVLPPLSSLADWTAFIDTAVTSLSIPTGAMGPGMAIPLAGLGAAITENDTITGTAAPNVFRGGLGDDRIFGKGWADTLFGGVGQDILSGGNGADRIEGQKGGDTLRGDAGGDMLLGGAGNDLLRGGGGNDDLLGGAGRDTLVGGGGADVLSGGKGFDILTGGAGADRFLFASGQGNNRITDFAATNNAEKIDLVQVTAITGMADLRANHMTQVGDDVVINDGAGLTITLADVVLADLHKADFIF